MKKLFAGIDLGHVILFLLMCSGFGLSAGMFYADVNTEQFIDTENGSVVRIGDQLYASVSEVGEDFLVGDGSGEGFIVSGGKTWIATDTPPVELTILTNPSCGVLCDTTYAVNTFRTQISPALIVDEVSSDSEVGQQLIDAFDIKGFPAYLVGSSISQIPSARGGTLTSDFPNIFKTSSDSELYLVDPSLDSSLRMAMYDQAPTFDIDPANIRGESNAPVRVVEFSAYYCGYCEKFFNEIGDTVNDLVEDGEIEYVVKHFPIGDDYTPHYAAICASEQDTFWEMHTMLFSKKAIWTRASDKTEAMYGFAEQLGLDMASFKTCMTSEKTQQKLTADISEARAYGVTGTPSFFLNNVARSGFMQPEVFKAMVESTPRN